jgi:hypothetical protein
MNEIVPVFPSTCGIGGSHPGSYRERQHRRSVSSGLTLNLREGGTLLPVRGCGPSVCDVVSRPQRTRLGPGIITMQTKLLHDENGKRTFAVILQHGDEAMRCLQEFATQQRLGASQITAARSVAPRSLSSTGTRKPTSRSPSTSRSRSRHWSAMWLLVLTASQASTCMPCSHGEMVRHSPGIYRKRTFGQPSRLSLRSRRRTCAREQTRKAGCRSSASLSSSAARRCNLLSK